MNISGSHFSIPMKLSTILLWMYLWILFVMQAISIDTEMTILFGLFLGILALVTSAVTLKILIKIIPILKLERENHHSCLVGVVVTAITFLVFEGYLAGQYPGGMSPDNVSQYSQALGETAYNDWHPVLHTLIFFTLPLRTGRRLGFIVFMQLIYFSLAFGYLCYALYKNRCPKLFLAFLCIYTWVNPFMATYMMYPWKDIGLTIVATLLMGFYIQIICTNGEWLQKKINLTFFSVIAVVCSYMRHNAILFVLPLTMLVLFYGLKSWKIRIAVVLVMVSAFSLVKITYAALDVQKPNSRVLETVGLPVTIWCNVMQKNPDSLPEKTQEVMYRLASPEAYINNYSTGSFNSIKWSGQMDTAAIDNFSYGEVIDYTVQCFVYAPTASLEALAKLTDMVWAVDGKDEPITPTVTENSWGIEKKPFSNAEILMNQMKTFFSAGFGKILFGAIGFMLLAMVIVALALLAIGRSSFLHILPLFCYNFGTMLLLSDADYRFFLLNLPLWMCVIFVMIQDKKKINIPIKFRKEKVSK